MGKEQNLLGALDAYAMLENQRGVLVGFSGGADSSAMLSLLKPICDTRGIYLHAMHVHHGIRGAEADRDARFCKDFCERLGVDFTPVSADIPRLAKESGRGVEETAREFRYGVFLEKVNSDERLTCIATAHNANDNAETVIFNLARGSGALGVSGIAPVREINGVTVIRPLIYAAKRDIVGYCEQNGIEYIFDSTNNDTMYTRNYIRHEIMPHLERLNPSFLSAATRMTENLRADLACLDSISEQFAMDNVCEGKIDVRVLDGVDKAIASRTVRAMFARVSDKTLERVHVDAVLELVKNYREGASLSLVGKVRAVYEGGRLYFTTDTPEPAREFEYMLSEGLNQFDEGFAVLVAGSGISDADLQKYNETLENIYKLSIHTRISFDKINHTLLVRSRREGDAYVFGGMTRKLKKLYNDRSYSAKKRAETPVFCDGEGIVWVPGFPTADRARAAKGAADVIYFYNGEE